MDTNSPRFEGETSRLPEGRRYANILRPPAVPAKTIPMKLIAYLRGEPKVIWEEEEVEKMIIKENLEFAVVGKFSYGFPAIQDLRKVITK